MTLRTIAGFALFCLCQAVHGQRIITSITAGNGDGGPATATRFHPFSAGMVFDSAGNLYFSERGANVVRRITTAGVISTYAGTGQNGFGGDGGPATSALLNSPMGLAVDSAGNLYIADQVNNRIRRVTPAGNISTVAGNGTGTFSGDNGQATAASINRPEGVAVDAAGNLYISDTNNWRIRRVSTAGVITTFAGGVTTGFTGDGGPATSAAISAPKGIAFDAAGNLLICDYGYRRIRRVTPGGTISTVAGNGTNTTSPGSLATATGFAPPDVIAVNSGGLVVFSSGAFFQAPIYRVTTAGILELVAGAQTAAGNTGDGGAATAANIASVRGLAFDPTGNLLLLAGDRIRRVTPGGVISTAFGGALNDGGASVDARVILDYGYGLAVDPAGGVLTLDTESRIRRIAGGNISTYAGNGLSNQGSPSADGTNISSFALNSPVALASAPNGDLYFADSNRIFRVTPSGSVTRIAGDGSFGFSGDDGPATAASLQLGGLTGLAVDSLGNVYVGDGFGHRVRRISAAGIITTVAGTGSSGFSGDGGPATSAALSLPVGLAVDSSNNLYIADSNNSRIRRVTPSGVISTIAGSTTGFAGDGGSATSARLALPAGLTFDSAGNLYVCDSGNNRIRRITPAGVITTYAGSGGSFSQGGFSGDGGPATSARLFNPQSIAFDLAGNLYIADNGNFRIRRVTPDVDPVLTSFVTVPAGLNISVAGVTYTTPTALALAPGSTVSIGAPSPQGFVPRHTFRSWSNGGTQSQSITIGSTAATYTATYGAQFALTTAARPSNAGTILFNPASSDGYYDAGAAVQLTAVPNSAYGFVSFSGSLSATTNPATITMSGAATVFANFGCNYTLSASAASVGAAAGSGTFSATGGTGVCASVLPSPTSNAAFLTASVSGTTITYQFTANTGAQRTGVITVGARSFTVTQAGAAPPSATDSGPLAGSGLNQVLVFRFSHPEGFANLGVLNVLINRALDGGNACYIAYSQPAGILFLVNDGGPDAGLSAPLVLGSAGTVSNSQCTIRGTGSSAVGSGNNFTLTLNLSFAPSFGGSKVIYTAARDNGAGNSGWKTLGHSQIPETAPAFPRTGAMTPTTVNATTQTVTLTYTDATSAANIVTGWMLINSAVDGGQACYVAYYAPANLVFLIPDNGDGGQATVMALSGTNTVENSQCRIHAQGSSTATAGGQLTVNLNVTMKAPFAGPRGVWTAMQNLAGQVSPWRISGSWLVP